MAIPFGTMQERHLVYVYVGMWVLQGGYLGWVVWAWFKARKPANS